MFSNIYYRTIYHDTKAKVPFTPAPGQTSAPVPEGPNGPFSAVESGDYEAGLTVIGEFDTVESFCRYFNWLKPPSKLERNSNYHLFKSGIKPMWEDEANANGGKWVLTMKNNPALLDRCWSWLAMALVGEELEDTDEICGAVVSLRSKVDRIQVWTRGKDDVERLNGIGKKLVKLLDVSEADSIGLEFQVRDKRIFHLLRTYTSVCLSTTVMIVHSPTSSSRSSPCHKHPTALPLLQVTPIKTLLAQGTPTAQSIRLRALARQGVRLEASELVALGVAEEGGKVERGLDLEQVREVCILWCVRSLCTVVPGRFPSFHAR